MSDLMIARTLLINWRAPKLPSRKGKMNLSERSGFRKFLSRKLRMWKRNYQKSIVREYVTSEPGFLEGMVLKLYNPLGEDVFHICIDWWRLHECRIQTSLVAFLLGCWLLTFSCHIYSFVMILLGTAAMAPRKLLIPWKQPLRSFWESRSQKLLQRSRSKSGCTRM